MVSSSPSLILPSLVVGVLLLASTAQINASSSSTTTAVTPPSSRTLRALEDNGYEYMESLSGYQMQFGKCVRVKVPNDDDDEEGNSYFYNGHYYAQGQQFASVYLCEGNDSCGSCDTSKEYVTDLATYLEASLGYAQALCSSCDAQCGRRQQRRLEDGGDEAEEEEEQEEEQAEEAAYMSVNCNSCRDTCQNMNFDYVNADDDGGNNNDNADGDAAAADETQYLDCQQAFQDESGNVIYAGPQCDGDGDITIGFYYDEDCTVKSSSQQMDFGFEYGTFQGIQEMCLDCDPYGNGEDDVCAELYQDSTHCANGKNLNGGDGDGDMPICKTVAKSHKEHFYGTHQKKWRIVESLIAFILIGGLSFAFFSLSYTYFLRHRRSSSSSGKEPLAENDYHSAPEVQVTNATLA